MKMILIRVSDKKNAIDILISALQLELKDIIIGLQHTKNMLRDCKKGYNMKSKEFYENL